MLNKALKRFFDLTISFLFLLILSPIFFIITILIRFTSAGAALHFSKRVGQDNKIFLMPKFRSMFIDAPQLATHLMTSPDQYVTPVGKFLRKTSLDELPQLWSIFIGDMSLVGPRPALFNQDDLVQLRTQKNIHTLKPGLTGWAQINGRDELPIPTKVDFDFYYYQNQSFYLDLKVLALTFRKVLRADGVSH